MRTNYYYYELTDGDPHAIRYGKYISNCIGFYSNLYYASDRIWKQDSTGVVFIKHRDITLCGKPADLDEFLVIKLKCQPI